MKRSVVLDASAALELVRGLEHAPAILEHLSNASLVHAPSIFQAEVANALWKIVRHGELDLETARRLYVRATGLVDVWVESAVLAEEALVEAVRHEHPVYDLLYAVTARRRGAAVLTMDRRLRSLLETLSIDCL